MFYLLISRDFIASLFSIFMADCLITFSYSLILRFGCHTPINDDDVLCISVIATESLLDSGCGVLGKGQQ